MRAKKKQKRAENGDEGKQTDAHKCRLSSNDRPQHTIHSLIVARAPFRPPHSLPKKDKLPFRSMLWVDKHRPNRLDSLDYAPNITKRLQALSADKNIPHLLFYGPSGSGKKTRINALLREMFGPTADRLRLDKRTFMTPTRRTVEINMICSNVHIELSPGDAGLYDRYVQYILRFLATD